MISLQKGWQFKEAGKSHWYPAAVSGCVHTDLLNNSLIPDPFYRDNETKLQWIGQTNWEYRTKFQVEPEMLRHKQIDLLFKGLDTYAAVFLNDLPILEADNMFREWRVPCKDKLRAGENTLRIMFRSPVNEILPKIKDLPYTLPAGNEQEFKTSPYTRKAPYQYGWDWGPRFVTMGIWQPVYLDVWNDAHLSGVWIQQKNLSKKTAELCAQVELHAMEEGTFQLVIQDEDHSFEPVVKTIRVSKGKHIDTVDFSLPNPKLWWPNGMGEPFLYTIEIKLLQNNREIDRTTVRTGLRTLELRRKTDRWGKSFEFVVNGSPVFARGGNWIPADNFPNRVTEENYRHLLKSCKEAHMNMLRVWGGGFYENDVFYDLCDEMGILIWQDFMFACSLYPGDAAFLENIRREAVFQVKRLRTHPSLALWCGNNEMEAGWSEWGWKTEFPEKVWEDYKKIFHGILPEVCRTFDPGCPYWPSSPSSNLEDTPSSQKTGDIHYWDVWHGEKPFEFYKKQFPRFMSEYGFQSFPAFETVKSFTRPEDWKLDSPVMLLHQKNKGGNQHIHNFMLRYFWEPKDFPAFLYLSQVLQAEGIKMGAEHLRRLKPRCMGSLYWQINDCWPVASWAGIDYYGRWKALQYYARRFYSPILVSPDSEKDSVRVSVVSDEPHVVPAVLFIELLNMDGEPLWQKQKAVEIPPDSAGVYFEIVPKELLKKWDPRNVFLYCEITNGNALFSKNELFFVSPKALALQKPKLRTEFLKIENGIQLTVTSDKLARDVFLSAETLEGFFSDNFFNVIPGKPVTVTFTSLNLVNPADFKTQFRMFSLTDTKI